MDTTTLVGIGAGLGGICVAGIAVLTFWLKFSDRISTAEADATAAAKQAAMILARVIELEKSHTDHRVSVAEEYVSKKILEALEDRLVKAIDRLGDRLDKLFKGTH